MSKSRFLLVGRLGLVSYVTISCACGSDDETATPVAPAAGATSIGGQAGSPGGAVASSGAISAGRGPGGATTGGVRGSAGGTNTGGTSGGNASASGGTVSQGGEPGGAPAGGVGTSIGGTGTGGLIGGNAGAPGGTTTAGGTATTGGADGGAGRGGNTRAGGASPAGMAGTTGGSAAVGAGGSPATSGGTAGVAGTGNGGAGKSACSLPPACDRQAPDPGPAQPWRHSVASALTTAQGDPQHRGRDLFLAPGDEQWVLAKFAYGLADSDLVDEDVAIYLLRNCAGDWELLGTTSTTDSGNHTTIEGVEDTGGRVYLRIPDPPLGIGRHRIHMVVRGDLTRAEQFIEVIEPATSIFVSDVDGTLTTQETEEYASLLSGSTSEANAGAPQALTLLAQRGMRPFYLTARPDWLDARTREFLQTRGFPPGILHTTLTSTGALGASAATFKTAELSALIAKGGAPLWGFGNTETDGQAYQAAGITPTQNRIFLQFQDPLGGRRIEAYTELLGELAALPACP